TLVAWQRPGGYEERRADGYQEPLLVLLVGTAHVSPLSAEHVTRVVQAARPDAVVVELCRSRASVMSEGQGSQEPGAGQQASSSRAGNKGEDQGGPGLFSLTGQVQGDMLGALTRSAALGGQSGLLLRLLLSGLARRTAGVLGVRPGAEFLAARRAAEAVGAQVVLGDRPLEISLQRAWAALPPLRRLAFCTQLLHASLSTGPSTLDAALVERLKSDDALSSMLAALGQAYPELMGPLLHERDAYLAWSLKRSKAVNGARCVVGVVGAGHLRGVVRALHEDSGGDTLRFSDLVDNMNRREVKEARRSAALTRLAVELVLGTAAFAAWQFYVSAGAP
ncbi:hypothetical protein QJQ45_015698, partial [Haematococcus lacustris]